MGHKLASFCCVIVKGEFFHPELSPSCLNNLDFCSLTSADQHLTAHITRLRCLHPRRCRHNIQRICAAGFKVAFCIFQSIALKIKKAVPDSCAAELGLAPIKRRFQQKMPTGVWNAANRLLLSQTGLLQYAFAPSDCRKSPQLANFLISSTANGRDRACVWLDTLFVDQSINAHTKAVVRVIFCLSWC